MRLASPKGGGRVALPPRRIAFATNAEFPEGAPDDRTVFPELERLGIAAVPVVWSDRSVAWSQFSAVVVRSTWGYDRRRDEFLGWAERVGSATQLWNPPALLRWNAHKGYLLELERAGVEIVPTELVRVGSDRTLASILRARGWTEVVVKPAVGANGAGLRIVRSPEISGGEAHLRSLLSEGDALVQPLLTRVEQIGERSLVFLEGVFSHAAEYPYVLRGGPREGAPTRIEPRVLESAARILSSVPGRTLYARVDLLPADGGEWLLSELELIEPYLHLRTDPSAPRRFAEAIRARVDGIS